MRNLSFVQGQDASRPARIVGVAIAAAVFAGCQGNKLTDVTTPDVVQPSSTQSVTALPAVFNSAIAEFTVAYAGSNGGGAGGSSNYGAIEGEILYGGLLGDEILLSDTFPTRREIDYRNIQLTNSNNDGVYRQLQIARVAAERSTAAYTALKASIPPSSLTSSLASQAEAYSLAGYTYLMFAEQYCGNVPFSTLNTDGSVTYDAGHTTTQILAIASAKFDSAIAIATPLGAAAASQLNLANIGKARTLVDQGNYVQAATFTAAVPTTYAYTLFTSLNTTRQNNGVWSFNRSQRRFSVATGEGGNGLAYRASSTTAGNATADPRVLVVRGNSGTQISGFDQSPLYVAVKYSEQTSPAILATGVEARLIEAEAAMNGGDYATALTKLNTLRSNTALYACPAGVTLNNFSCPATQSTALAPLTDPGTAQGRVLQLFQERAFWMYLTAHRLGDMRRLSRTGGGGANAAAGLSAYGDVTGGVSKVFPVGVYAPQTTVNYGSNTSLPVPYSEQTANTKYNPAACDDNTP